MSPKLNKISIISSIITSYYQKLVNLIYEGNKNNDEYNEILEKIKEIIKLEKESYNNIDLKTIKDYYNEINLDGDNPIENRCFSRLSEREKSLCGEPRSNNGMLLSVVIDGKIMIDVLKLVHKRLHELKEEDINAYENLMMYYEVSKFTYLTDSSFLEDLALKYDFNVEEIPSLSFEEISKSFNIDIKNNFMEIIYLNIFTELNALYEISEKDKMLNTYLALTELSRIEVLLSYLDEKTLDRLINAYQEEYGDSNKETMINAAILIKKRKKEFK